MATFLAQVGRFSARHRLLVVIAWLAVLAGLAGVLAANGTGESAEDTIPDSRASQALERMAAEFPGSTPTTARRPCSSSSTRTRATSPTRPSRRGSARCSRRRPTCPAWSP